MYKRPQVASSVGTAVGQRHQRIHIYQHQSVDENITCKKDFINSTFFSPVLNYPIKNLSCNPYEFDIVRIQFKR